MKKAVLVSLFLILLSGTVSAGSQYVFLFIGDGMGAAQVAAAQAYLQKKSQALSFMHFPVQKKIRTDNACFLTTDSAAAGTALACGKKTCNRRIAKSALLRKDLKTIAELAKDNNYSVGLVTSVSLDHATPAVFYAHTNSRKKYVSIAQQLAGSKIDFLGGGGLAAEKTFPAIWQAVKKTFFVTHRFPLVLLKKGVFFIAPVLAKGAALPYALDSRQGYSLKDFTRAAIQQLQKNPKGFFLMVEGGKIDWAAHANDGAALVQEIIEFNKAIDAALEFYKKNPQETLILITADHETGGLVLTSTENITLLDKQKASHETIDALLSKPQFVSKKNVEKFFSADTFNNGLLPFYLSLPKLRGTYLSSLTGYLLYDLNCRAGLRWTTHQHTSSPVPLYALGNGAHNFSQCGHLRHIGKQLLKKFAQ